MKILILNWRDITHPWAGGAERHLHELAKQWIKMGHEVFFLCGGYKGALRRETIDGIRIIRIGDTYSAYLLVPIYYLLKLRDKKFDCIIDTSHGVSFFTPLITRRPKVLIVHHNHEKLWRTEFGGFVSKLGIFLENKVIPWLYKKIPVITLSQTEKILLEKMGFERVFAIPPGIENRLFIRGKKAKVPTILYFGRLRRYKRVDILINGFSKIKSALPKVRLVIAGDGQDKARLENIARNKGLNGDIIFKGFVSEEEKLKLLQESWLLAFPSLMEGWGLVAMEAAACGTPTVGFKVPGVKDSVNDGISGLLANSREEFLKAIVDVLKNKTLRSRLSEGAQKWSRKFTWETAANDFLKVIEAAIQRGRYDKGYFSSFWRLSYKRKFHPVYDFRAWYISKLLKPKDLLDVGSGPGLLVSKLREKGIRAFGLDISKDALLLSSLSAKKYLRIGDIRNLPFRNRKFDAVSCVDVLEHIEKDDLAKAIRECARVAKRVIYFEITCLEDILFVFLDSTHVSKFFSWQWKNLIQKSLGSNWVVKRGPIVPFIHHGIFVAKRREYVLDKIS